MAVSILSELCVGCGACLKSCPYDAIDLVDRKAVMNEKCVHCAACVESCKFKAIISDSKQAGTKDLSAYSGVLVFAETRHDELSKVSLELLGIGRTLAETRRTTLSAVLIGSHVERHAATLIAYGAQKVVVVEDKQLEYYLTGPFSRVLTSVIQKVLPEIVLIGATSIGRDLAPRTANRLKTGLTADCTELAIDEKTGLLLQTRPAFGGNIMATIVCPNHRPQMSTVRPGVMKPIAKDPNLKGEIIRMSVKIKESDLLVKVMDTITDAAKKIDISQADMIVSGGRGMGGKPGFDLLRNVAAELGAQIGASRAAVESGWIGQEHQVGQTGKSVAPKLYIACGISGAIQHLAGISGADYVVAINRDPDAPIFKRADIGIVGDVSSVLPVLADKLRNYRKEQVS